MFKACTCCFVAMFLVAACAIGNIPREGADADVNVDKRDAHFVTGDSHVFNDAALYDAKVFHDAPAMPDAGGGGGFCSVNSDCPVPSECCWVALCVPGARVGNNLCFPQ